MIWEDRLPLCNWFSLKAARHSFQSTFFKMTIVCPGRKGKKKSLRWLKISNLNSRLVSTRVSRKPCQYRQFIWEILKAAKLRESMQRFLVLGMRQKEIQGHIVVTHDFNQHAQAHDIVVRKAFRTTQCDRRNIVSHMWFLSKSTQIQRKG